MYMSTYDWHDFLWDKDVQDGVNTSRKIPLPPQKKKKSKSNKIASQSSTDGRIDPNYRKASLNTTKWGLNIPVRKEGGEIGILNSSGTQS